MKLQLESNVMCILYESRDYTTEQPIKECGYLHIVVFLLTILVTLAGV